MSTIVTRSGKGAALTHTEVDANFTNLNTDKADASAVILATEKGAVSGVCPLDAASKVSSTYLPSYVDDVLEYANYAALPATGETGKIYVALDTNKTYRWSGSAYIYITSGAVDSVAGKTGVVTLTAADVGLGNVTNNAAVANLSGTNTGDQILPTTLPASDVSAWAKAATKPTYTYTEVGAQVAGTYATGTGSATGVNTGDETTATIKTKLGVTTLSGSNTGDQVLPTTLPASDVSAWAKSATKPTYTYTEVGAQVAGTYATGTGSATGVNTGDQTNISGTAAGLSVTLAVASGGTGVTTSSGTGNNVLSTSPTLVTPILGTPTSGTLTNCTFPTLNQNTTGSSASCTGNATTATTATNVAGGVAGSVHYQTAASTTAMTAASTVAGQVLTTVTAGGAPTWVSPAGGGGSLLRQTVFTASGTWTKGAGTSKILVQGVGGGGGGGGGAYFSSGAGAGGYASKFVNVTSISTVSVTIGSGGAGGSGADGTSGGTTSFGSHFTCNGGNGGQFISVYPTVKGGLGGSASGGDVNISGGCGGSGVKGASPNFTYSTGGIGASSFYGGGGAAAQYGGVAENGYAAGSGGGGTGYNSGGVYTGGTGANGIVIILEFA
jgi:hypothetical protein